MKMQNRSIFDLTHERKLTCDMGKLVPIMCEEVLPGDTFKVNTQMLIRLSPLVAPMMHRVSAFIHFFYVPSRIVHANWEPFITGGEDGLDATAIPTVNSGAGWAAGSLADYFGLPVDVADLDVLAYPFRAYAAIYNAWYRAEQLQDKVAVVLTDGADATTNQDLLSRNWEKDYFTSALLQPQRGAAVSLPLGTEAPVLGIAKYDTEWSGVNGTGMDAKGNNVTYSNYMNPSDAGSGNAFRIEKSLIHNGPRIRADLSAATAATVNDLRASFQLQRWLEKNARAGARLPEMLWEHFHVTSSDARLQRPEFLGGGRSPIVVSEVIQTSATVAGQTAQGNMAGHGFSAQQSHSFVKSFEEHGYIIGIMSIMPRTAYQQGVPRMWNRSSKLDFFWPSFAHLGEQAIKCKEIYAEAADPDATFGYAPRYEEYRQRESSVHGDFKTTLSYWHMGRIFANEPELNEDFVMADPTKRIHAVTNAHTCWVQLVNQVQAIRPIPKQGIPGLIDH